MLDVEKEGKKIDGFATEMWNDMTKEFGDEWEKWPIVGCNAGFSAYKRGPSMVFGDGD